MMDVLRDTVYESDDNLMMLDLSSTAPLFCEIQEILDEDFNTSFVINDMLVHLKYRELFKQTFRRELSEIVCARFKEFSEIPPVIARNKTIALNEAVNKLNETAHVLRQLFINYDLYNVSGSLRLTSVVADNLSNTLGVLRKPRCTEPLSIHSSQKSLRPRIIYSTSQQSCEYLKKILL